MLATSGLEEFQLYYELADKDAVSEIADLLSKIMAVGPSAGVVLIGASQKPSGVGAGDVGRLFNRFRDNFAVRFALKCGNRIVSDAILGGDAYARATTPRRCRSVRSTWRRDPLRPVRETPSSGRSWRPARTRRPS